MIKYPGLEINIEKLAAGTYELIKESPNGACLTLGMFPAEIMEALGNSLASRIPDSYIDPETLDTVDGKDIRHEIEHAICCHILDLATDEGVCIV